MSDQYESHAIIGALFEEPYGYVLKSIHGTMYFDSLEVAERSWRREVDLDKKATLVQLYLWPSNTATAEKLEINRAWCANILEKELACREATIRSVIEALKAKPICGSDAASSTASSLQDPSVHRPEASQNTHQVCPFCLQPEAHQDDDE